MAPIESQGLIQDNNGIRDDVHMLIHKGLFVNTLLRCQKIETFTLSHGWNKDKEYAFCGAIERVVKENQILTSRVVKSKGTISVIPGSFPLHRHKFVTVMDLSSSHHRPSALTTPQEQLDFIHEHIVPLLNRKQTCVMGEIKNQEPLFVTNLVMLPGGYACYHVSLSHCLGDASTYYLLMEQISAAMNQEPLIKINWGNDELTTHENTPKHYSKRDVNRCSGLPFFLGAVRRLATIPQRQEQHLTLCRAKINQKKKELVNPDTTNYLSSHDILLSALCKLNKSCHEVSIAMDMRDRTDVFNDRDGGNCVSQFSLPRKVGTDPNAVRQAVKKGHYFERNQVRLGPYCKGRVCLTTNWSSRAKTLQGVSTTCHVPAMSFFRDMPFDMALIYHINDDCIGVVHNFLQEDQDSKAIELFRELAYW